MEIDIDDAIRRSDLIFIDVRAPGEYAFASIPGAVNIPLFDDREHRQLGIIFRQLGESEARRVALDFVLPKLPFLITQIEKSCGGKLPLLYCRRGGLRSLSLYQVLTLGGIPAMRLKKGYKAYRQYVNERLAGFTMSSRLFVLHGLTGVGKTAVLKILGDKGMPVIDLEELARHRGSVFGNLGLDAPRSQKDFDALLLKELDQLSHEPSIFIEGEGHRIGNVYLPRFLTEAMDQGKQILLTAPLEIRVQRILDIYSPLLMPGNRIIQIRDALRSLENRMGSNKVELLLKMLDNREYGNLARMLCTDYYDHFYHDSRPEYSRFDLLIDATDLNQTAGNIIDYNNSFYRKETAYDESLRCRSQSG
ncbi:MAG: tRNA 2-selenouridine(34) synthase MnmH [Bacillota bacterium]|nr:tRNA 2-selenouridine(34) synthase MnmH [Bacillota bacterium]